MSGKKADKDDKCLKCKMGSEKDNNWVLCDRCNKWSHQACTYLKDIPKKGISDIPYYCDKCAIELQCVDREMKELKELLEDMRNAMIETRKEVRNVKDDLSKTSAKVIALESVELESWMTAIHDDLSEIKGEITELKNKEKAEEINNRLEIVTSELKNVVNNVDDKKNKSTYADTLKTKKMLIVKSTKNGEKAADNKKEILGKLKTQVEAVNETKDGHLAVRFTNKENLEAAKKEIEVNSEISVNEVGKMKPKIKIVNVSKEDDDVFQSIKMKNAWIANLIEDEDDFK